MTHKVEKCPTCGATLISDVHGVIDYMVGWQARLHEVHRLIDLLDRDILEITDNLKLVSDKLKLETIPGERQP